MAGYIHATRFECLYHDPLFDSCSLSVLPDYQRKVIGKNLLNSGEETVKIMDISEIRVNSNVIHEETRQFYESCGYISLKKQIPFMKHVLL